MTDSPEFHGAAPWIACSNLTATVDHYRNVLGFDGDWHWFWGEPPDHAGVSRDKTRILFVESPAKAERCRGSEVVVYVRHVAALYEELQGSGGQYRSGIWRASVGNVGLHGRRPRRGVFDLYRGAGIGPAASKKNPICDLASEI